MKRKFLAALIIAVLSSTAQAQNTVRTPDWVCESGYWVVESNLQSAREQTIFFYNDQNLLIGKESIVGKKLKLHKPRVLRFLKKELESKLQNWAMR
ncbi:MAG: hypothetical protein ACK4E0_04960 [Chitinophagaceae bacterium]